MPDIDRETAIKRLSATRDWLRDRYEGSNNDLFQRDTEALDFAIRELKKPRAMACCIDIDKKMVYTFCCGIECNDWSECQGKKYWREYVEQKD